MPQTSCSTREMWHPLLQALYQSWTRPVLTLPWCSKRIYSFSQMVFFFILRSSIVDDSNCLLCREYVLRYYKLMLWVCLIRSTCASTCLYIQLHICNQQRDWMYSCAILIVLQIASSSTCCLIANPSRVPNPSFYGTLHCTCLVLYFRYVN